MPPSSRRRRARQPLRKNQGGYALIVLLAIVTMGILYSIVSALTPMQAKYSNRQQPRMPSGKPRRH